MHAECPTRHVPSGRSVRIVMGSRSPPELGGESGEPSLRSAVERHTDAADYVIAPRAGMRMRGCHRNTAA